MKKPLTWAVLIIFVVLVPFGSWYYLKQGLEYRKTLLRELQPKDSLDLSGQASVFSGKTTLIIFDSEKALDSSFIARVTQQYGAVPTFQIVTFEPSDKWVSLNPALKDSLFGNYTKDAFLIIDTQGRIRNSYSEDEKSITKMIEHFAVVLPRPGEPDIKMKQ